MAESNETDLRVFGVPHFERTFNPFWVARQKMIQGVHEKGHNFLESLGVPIDVEYVEANRTTNNDDIYGYALPGENMYGLTREFIDNELGFKGLVSGRGMIQTELVALHEMGHVARDLSVGEKPGDDEQMEAVISEGIAHSVELLFAKERKNQLGGLASLAGATQPIDDLLNVVELLEEDEQDELFPSSIWAYTEYERDVRGNFRVDDGPIGHEGRNVGVYIVYNHLRNGHDLSDLVQRSAEDLMSSW